MCFFAYDHDIDSVRLVDALIAQRSTMVVPGAHFGCERHLRIGFGMARDTLDSGLVALESSLQDAVAPARV